MPHPLPASAWVKKPGAEWNDDDFRCAQEWLQANAVYFKAFTLRRLNLKANTLGLRATATKEDAEDFYQRALKPLYVYRFRTFEPSKGNFSAYVHTCIGNACTRWEPPDPALPELPNDEGDPVEIEIADDDPRSNPENSLLRNELVGIVQDCINTLCPKYRDVQTLDLQEVEPENIAIRLGITRNLVKVRLFRARQKIRDCLIAKGIGKGRA